MSLTSSPSDTNTVTPKYKRVLLKLSGEALMGENAYGIDQPTLLRISTEIAEVVALGVQIAIVIGGGNIFRGMGGASGGMDRATADYMGMLATLMNSMALQDELRRTGLVAHIQSALAVEQIVEAYSRNKSLRYLEQNEVVIFGAGTGNPFFTTDTAAALRGTEIGAEVVLKATKVDGVYSADPAIHSEAQRFEQITFDEAIARNLRVMDTTAFTLCREQALNLIVFSILRKGALRRTILGEAEGTLLHV